MYIERPLLSWFRFVLVVCGFVCLTTTFVVFAANAQDIDPTRSELWDVVETRDGSVWKGVIVENIPNERYRVALPGGSIVVVNAHDVVRISKVGNPNSVLSPDQTPVPASTPGVRDPLTVPLGAQGIRLSFSPGFAACTSSLSESLNVSFLLSVRGGYEFMFGRFGLTTSFRLDYVAWRISQGSSDQSLHYVHPGVELRVAGHFRHIVPFLALGFGEDFNIFRVSGYESDSGTTKTAGFGLDVTFGVDLLLTRSFALGLGLNLHPAMVRVVGGDSPKLGFFGTLFSLTYYGS